MKLRRVMDGALPAVQVSVTGGWVDVARASGCRSELTPSAPAGLTDAVALLGAPAGVREAILERAARIAPDANDARTPTLPFAPRSFRDFMLYERHAIDAARGFVRTFMPRAWPLVRAWRQRSARPSRRSSRTRSGRASRSTTWAITSPSRATATSAIPALHAGARLRAGARFRAVA